MDIRFCRAIKWSGTRGLDGCGSLGSNRSHGGRGLRVDQVHGELRERDIGVLLFGQRLVEPLDIRLPPEQRREGA